ncbi:MAG TPA: aspartate kinase [Ignavibacteriaceae bacterium]|nr:aspartate kinase [Ignavibacteriaceae bacterium]
MSIVVQKYGGSSVADADKIKSIAKKIYDVKKSGNDVVVVVSAMGKTTDSLIELAKSISSNPQKREMDMLLSTGERITMSLLCIALNELGIESISLTGSQAGIITNDRHNDARVIEVRPFRVLDELANDKVVVVGGFQGVSYKRDITTLGRGGSDTSAVALAAALNAERCEIYSDVEGVYSADPSAISEALHLPELSYEIMQEMSEAGAKVLNAQAVQFAKEAKIAIYARKSSGGEKETIVRLMPAGLFKGVKAVVHENDLIRLIFTGSKNQKNIYEFLKLAEKTQYKIKELNYATSNKKDGLGKASIIISGKNIIDSKAFEYELSNNFGDGVLIEKGLGAVSLIGDGINRDNKIIIESLNLLEESKIKVLGISTTSFRITFLLLDKSVKDCTRVCHKKWIEDIS